MYDPTGEGIASNTGEWTDADLIEYESNLSQKTVDTRQDTMDWLYGKQYTAEDVNDQWYDDWRATGGSEYDNAMAAWQDQSGFTAEDYANNPEAKASGDAFAADWRSKEGYNYDINEIDSVTDIQQGIIGEGSEYLDRAMMKGRSSAGGGVFSSMGSEAAAGAMLDRSLEMAQADSDVQKYNEGASTDRGKLRTQAAAGIAGKTQDSINTGIQQGREFVGNQFLNKQQATINQDQAKLAADLEKERLAIEQEYDLEDKDWDSYYDRLGKHDAHKYAIMAKEFEHGLSMTADEAKYNAEFQTELMKADANLYRYFMETMNSIMASESENKEDLVASLRGLLSEAKVSANKYKDLDFSGIGGSFTKPNAEDYFGDAPVKPGEEDGVLGDVPTDTDIIMEPSQQAVYDKAVAQWPAQAQASTDWFNANATEDMTKAEYDVLWQKAFSRFFTADDNANPILKPEGEASEDQTAVVGSLMEKYPTQAQEAIDYFEANKEPYMTQDMYDVLWQESLDRFFDGGLNPKNPADIPPIEEAPSPVDTGDSVLDSTTPDVPPPLPTSGDSTTPTTPDGGTTYYDQWGTEYKGQWAQGNASAANAAGVDTSGGTYGTTTEGYTEGSSITQATLDGWQKSNPDAYNTALENLNNNDSFNSLGEQVIKDNIIIVTALRDGFDLSDPAFSDIEGKTWDDISQDIGGGASIVHVGTADSSTVVNIYKADPVTLEEVQAKLANETKGPIAYEYYQILEEDYKDETGHLLEQGTQDWYAIIRQAAAEYDIFF